MLVTIAVYRSPPADPHLTHLTPVPREHCRADAPCGAELLQRSAGKDVTKPFEAAQHSPQAMELLKGLLVGPLLEPDTEPAAAAGAADTSSLSSPLVDAERSLALLLGLQAAALYRGTPPQPAELQAAPLLQTGVFDGGLEVRPPRRLTARGRASEGDGLLVLSISRSQII